MKSTPIVNNSYINNTYTCISVDPKVMSPTSSIGVVLNHSNNTCVNVQNFFLIKVTTPHHKSTLILTFLFQRKLHC